MSKKVIWSLRLFLIGSDGKALLKFMEIPSISTELRAPGCLTLLPVHSPSSKSQTILNITNWAQRKQQSFKKHCLQPIVKSPQRKSLPEFRIESSPLNQQVGILMLLLSPFMVTIWQLAIAGQVPIQIIQLLRFIRLTPPYLLWKSIGKLIHFP